MKILRVLRNLLLAAVALAVLATLALFAPPLQAWIAQRALQSLVAESGVGSLTAGFGRLSAEDIHLEGPVARVTLPSLEAELGLIEALWSHRVHLHSLTAKGWTLDLRAPAERSGKAAADAPSGVQDAAHDAAMAAQRAAGLLGGVLGRARFPFDLAVDQVELEGDVLLPGRSPSTPARVHLILTGGGLAAGREGVFSMDAASTWGASADLADAATVHGELRIGMASARVVDRLSVQADLASAGGLFPGNVALAAGVVAQPGGEAYHLSLERAGRSLVAVTTDLSSASGRLMGTWQVHLTDGDLTALAREHPLPSLTLSGEGALDSDVQLQSVHATGRVHAAAAHLGALAGPLEAAGSVTADAVFEGVGGAAGVRVDHLGVSLAGEHPAVAGRGLQPFSVDLHSGSVTPSDPAKPWFEVRLEAVPLAWWCGALPAGTLAGHDVAGLLEVSQEGARTRVRSVEPLAASGLSVATPSGKAARDLSLVVPLSGSFGADSWQVRCESVAIAVSGKPLLSCLLEASQAAAAQPVSLSAKGEVSLANAAGNPALGGLSWIRGKTAQFQLTATPGPSLVVDGHVLVQGQSVDRSIDVHPHLEIDPSGSVDFTLPTTLKAGGTETDLTAEGTWSSDPDGLHLDAKVDGEHAELEPLEVLAGALAGAGGHPLTERAPGDAGPRDATPFWGNWVGSLRLAFGELRAQGRDLKLAAGDLEFDHRALKLLKGRAEVSQDNLDKWEGTLAFDPAAEVPYALSATGSMGDVSAATFFPAKRDADLPLVEGKFTVATGLRGKGLNLGDLRDRTQQVFRLESSGGILRLLKVSIADAIPESPSTVGDELGSVGSAVGSIFGIKHDDYSNGKNRLTTNADAVLNVTNNLTEIAFDHASAEALRDADGTLHLEHMDLESAEEHLTGSGGITGSQARPLGSRPLSLDLQVGVMGDMLKLMAKAGLVSPQKDALGYTLLPGTFHFGGTLSTPDSQAWHDFLAEAANRKLPNPKSPAPGAAH